MSRLLIAVLSLTAALCLCNAAYAGSIPSTDGWTLTPVVEGSTITFLLGIDNMSELLAYDGIVTKSWGDPTLSDPTKFLSFGDDGGTLRSLTIEVDADPQVSLSFDYVAGPSGNKVVVTPNIVSFPALTNPMGRATAAITVTDRNGDGAFVSGMHDGRMYQTYYAMENVPTVAYFTSLIDGPITVPAYLSDTRHESCDWQVLTGDVKWICSEFAFNLSPEDSASGTSVFIVQPVPEPGSMVALLSGCAGLLGFIRRRRCS